MRIPHARRRVQFWLSVACVLVAVGSPGTAQQTVPFDGAIPVAPAGFEPQPIPAEPIEYNTAEVMWIRVVPVARGLVNPWSLAFLPTGELLVTERSARRAFRAIDLPAEVRPELAKAALSCGVLTLRLPRAEPPESHQTEVRGG